METVSFKDGVAIHADSTSPEVFEYVLSLTGLVPLINTDPPYGNIVDEDWDETEMDAVTFAQWMVDWTRQWTKLLVPGGAFYVWGGIGVVEFRPFLHYIPMVETKQFQLANLITWSKKRAFGVPRNYLFTREELAFFVNGDAKKPHLFNIPLLETKRGYAGYNPKYPAKSEFYRRTNVWTDITEILRGKRHRTQKPLRCMEVPIEVHTNPGDWVVDLFAGAGTTAMAARKLDRRFVVIEKKPEEFEKLVAWLRGEIPPPEPEETPKELFDLAHGMPEE